MSSGIDALHYRVGNKIQLVVTACLTIRVGTCHATNKVDPCGTTSQIAKYRSHSVGIVRSKQIIVKEFAKSMVHEFTICTECISMVMHMLYPMSVFTNLCSGVVIAASQGLLQDLAVC